MTTMNMLQRWLGWLAMVASLGLVLAACGGGGGSSGSSPFVPAGGGSGATAVADLVIALAPATLPNTGATTVAATITAVDASRNALPGVAVAVSANSDAVVTVQGSNGLITGPTGSVQVTVGVGSNTSNRTIVLTASANSGSIVKSASIAVVDATAGSLPSSIEIIASATSVGTGGDPVVVTAFVKDANNNALPGVPVAFTADTGTLSSIVSSTNAAGAATANFASGSNRNNRNATIRVATGAVQKSLVLPITGTRLALSGPSSLVRGTTGSFDIVVTDSKANVVTGAPVLASSGLANQLATTAAGSLTNASGQIRYTYLASNPGTDNLVFTLADSSLPTTVSPQPALVVSGQNFGFVSPAAGSTVAVGSSQIVRVQLLPAPAPGLTIAFAATGGVISAPSAVTDGAGFAQTTVTSSSAGPLTVQATVAGGSASATLPLNIVAITASRLTLQVSPTAVAPNAGSGSANQVQVTARVVDANGNPVAGQTVNFTRLVDPSGGNLLQASATTDANGQASVAYRSGAQSTADNGVQLQASVAGTSVSGTASLTVNQSALFIALGTGNVITNLDPQTYQKDWVVYVTDANGIPVNGAVLTVKAIPTHYLTGYLAWDGVKWDYAAPPKFCPNEDANKNGVLDAGEDINGDGVLWPGNVIAVTPGQVQTANGRATISLVYAESYVPWVRLRLSASATVAGTESSSSVEFVAAGAASDFSSLGNPPAGIVSPFGLAPRGGATGACLNTPP